MRRRAEARLRERKRGQKSEADTQRLFHELEVHQVELEMQNAELHRARNDLEAALANYTDLYDFAPVGYLSVDEAGVILEANLTGAALLGIERSRLIRRRLQLLASAASRPVLSKFLRDAFSSTDNQACEALLLREGGDPFWASLRATSAVALKGTSRWCRIAFGDVSVRKQAEEAHRRLEIITETNAGLKQEILRRQKVEQALLKSEREQRRLREQSRWLSHKVLHAQEEERKRISRELHDDIAQTLVGINIHLATLTHETEALPRSLRQKIMRTQRLMEDAVETVQRFARDLRPTALDDLGLVPALHTFLKDFARQTGVHFRLTTFAALEQMSIVDKTVLYRVAHEALTNVARHAKASRVEVSIRAQSDRIVMKISDDGHSFRVQHTVRTAGNKHLGLLGMRERLEMVGGSLGVESTPGHGTTITAELPLRPVRAARNRPKPSRGPTA